MAKSGKKVGGKRNKYIEEGNFKIRKFYGGNREKYLRDFAKQNKEFIGTRYEEELSKAKKLDKEYGEKRFKQFYKDIEDFTVKKFKAEARYSDTFEKAFKNTLRLGLTSAKTIFTENLVEGMKSFGVYDEFLFLINEEFVFDKIEYQGSGMYSYTNDLGEVIIIDVTNSPTDINIYKEEI